VRTYEVTANLASRNLGLKNESETIYIF